MPKLPIVSGSQCVKALGKIGFYYVRQTGSHIHIKRDTPHTQLAIPNHRELKKGLLRSLIRDAGLTVDEFIDLL